MLEHIAQGHQVQLAKGLDFSFLKFPSLASFHPHTAHHDLHQSGLPAQIFGSASLRNLVDVLDQGNSILPITVINS